MDESSLDASFLRPNLTHDELLHELRKKDLECNFLRQTIENKEREFLAKEQAIRRDITKSVDDARSSDKVYLDEQLKIRDQYYQKKV